MTAAIATEDDALHGLAPPPRPPRHRHPGQRPRRPPRRRPGPPAPEHARLTADRATLADDLAAHAALAAAAAADLAALHALAGTETDAALTAAIAHAAEHARLTALVDTHATTLNQAADGKPEAALADEAATVEIDTIPGRLAEITARLASLGTEQTEAAAERAIRQAEREAMQHGQDVAGPAQAVQDSLARIEDAASRYVRLRLAHAMLRGGIERFRRSQQGPLLTEAGALFAELTGARYDRLEQDEDPKGDPIIVAVRPDASTCTVEMLSEGTRDQLFLALRLAAIRLDAHQAEPMPFIADDLLVNFDDNRAAAALRLLARFGQDTQVILFTHHRHLVDMTDPATATIHRLPRELAA